MTATVERAQANDPRALKRRIADLERELRERPTPEPEIREVPVLREEDARAMRGLAESLNLHDSLLTELRRQFDDMREHIGTVVGERPIETPQEPIQPRVSRTRGAGRETRPVAPALREARPPTPDAVRASSQTGTLPKAERTVLMVLADVFPQGLAKDELARRCDYEPTGGGFNNALSRLRTLELITRGAEIRLTDEFGEAIQ